MSELSEILVKNSKNFIEIFYDKVENELMIFSNMGHTSIIIFGDKFNTLNKKLLKSVPFIKRRFL